MGVYHEGVGNANGRTSIFYVFQMNITNGTKVMEV